MGSELALINLTGGPLDINTVYFSVWNDNEFAMSATRPFNCWFNCPLAQISPLFTQAFLACTPNAAARPTCPAWRPSSTAPPQ